MDAQHERFTKLEERFWELTDAIDKKRKLDREVELEQDPELKDATFDKMLTATRQTIRKRGALERTVNEQLQKINKSK
jgi:hypothetical protein